MKNIKLSPSILSADFSKLGEEIKLVEKAGADWIHVDVMDGHFVPNLTIGPVIVEAARRATKLPLDVHLMIDNPEKFIPAFIEAGANIISIHAEVCHDIYTTLKYIKNHDVKASIAINPLTPMNIIKEILPQVNMVLIMTVNPGFGGQKFMNEVVPKIKELKKYCLEQHLDIEIEVDGGINFATGKKVLDAGATALVAGSFIYKAKKPAEVVKKFKQLFKKYV